jgi:hypothetical protein
MVDTTKLPSVKKGPEKFGENVVRTSEWWICVQEMLCLRHVGLFLDRYADVL